jgi:diaminohydroxyphosphoribosylaminopyrimidine deaminase / 5-amino-6-(5-phosphoribosylamino)uracil reductase
MEMTDKQAMERALNLAEKARGKTSPNPMVGAVIINNGKVVGEGFHEAAGEPHAEINALRQAGDEAAGATLYVTLEPCCTHGRTPPCTNAIIAAGIKKVIAAMEDPNKNVAGKGLASLRAAGIEADAGIMSVEARKLNETYIKYITTGRPYTIIKVAQTLDGKICTVTGNSRWISGGESRQFVHSLRDEIDSILVGVNTVIKDDPELTTRLENRNGRHPRPVILDRKARTPLESRVLSMADIRKPIIFTSALADDADIDRLSARGAEIIRSDKSNIEWEFVMKSLGEREITSLLVEGGQRILTSLIDAHMRNKMVDKWFFIIGPKLVGGASAPTSYGGSGIHSMDDALRLKNITVHRLEDDVVIEAYS